MPEAQRLINTDDVTATARSGGKWVDDNDATYSTSIKDSFLTLVKAIAFAICIVPFVFLAIDLSLFSGIIAGGAIFVFIGLFLWGRVNPTPQQADIPGMTIVHRDKIFYDKYFLDSNLGNDSNDPMIFIPKGLP